MTQAQVNTPKKISVNCKSSLDIKETDASKERVKADLEVSDPAPERAKAVLDGKHTS